MKKVYKYGTGEVLPEGAMYLSTKVETRTDSRANGGETISFTKNMLVWHYFLVEVKIDNEQT